MAHLPETRYSLLAQLAGENSGAWSEFLQTYEAAVYRYSRSHGLQDADARDVVQQVLLAVHAIADKWQPSGRAGSFRNWLLQTTHRTSLKVIRGRARLAVAQGGTSTFHKLHEISDDVSEWSDDGPESEREWRQWAFYWVAGKVQSEVQPHTWRAFWLSAVEGLPPGDVARQLEMKVGAVHAAKCRVLARIREQARTLAERDR